MSEIPAVRVVRGAAGGGEARWEARGDAPAGPVLRLAPRAVPWGVSLRLLFGGSFASLGWLMAFLAMAVLLVRLAGGDVGDVDYDRRATATLTHIDEAAEMDSDRALHRVHYTFVDEAGVRHDGASYTQSPPELPGSWSVDYRSDAPALSRLGGMRARPSEPPPSSSLLCFVAFGVVLALPRLVRGHRDLRLLRRGQETRGKLLHKEGTGFHLNHAEVIALTFEYEAEGKTYTTRVKTTDPEALEDDEREAMLYDPEQPSRVTPLDHLPGAPRINAHGQLESRGSSVSSVIMSVLFTVVVTLVMLDAMTG